MEKCSPLILNIAFESVKKLGKELNTVSVEVKLHSFLTSAVDGGKRSVSRPSRKIPGTL
jgi:hypothetical protein